MTLRYLLDTNIISEPVRPLPNANVMAKLIEAKLTIGLTPNFHCIIISKQPKKLSISCLLVRLEEEATCL